MIRLAEVDDAGQISQLWAKMVAEHAELDPDTFRLSLNGAEVYARFVEDRIADSDSRVLVAEADGALVGYICGGIAEIRAEMFEPLRCGLISDIFVGESHRRQGVGRELVERLALWFQARDVRAFEWYTSAHNPSALAFWRALGGEISMLRMRATIPEDDE